MRAKIGWITAPEAVEPVLVRLVDKPIAVFVCYALTRDRASDLCVGKSRFHDRCMDGERIADVSANVSGEVTEVARRIGARADENVRRLRQCFV